MCLSMLSPFQLVIIGTLLTFVISDNRDAGELNVIGNLIVAIGSLVLTVAAQKEFINSKNDNNESRDELQKQIKDLQEKYAKIECKTIY